MGGDEPGMSDPIYKVGEPIKVYKDDVVKLQAWLDVLGDGTLVDESQKLINGDNISYVSFAFNSPAITDTKDEVTITSEYENATNFVTYLDKVDEETSNFTLTESATVSAYTKITNGNHGVFTTKSSSKDVYVLNQIKETKIIQVSAGIAKDSLNKDGMTTDYYVEGGAISADKIDFFVKNLEFGVVTSKVDSIKQFQIDGQEVYIKMNNTNISFCVAAGDSVDVEVVCSKNACKDVFIDAVDSKTQKPSFRSCYVNVNGTTYGYDDITNGDIKNLDGFNNVIKFGLKAADTDTIFTFQKYSGTGNILISSIKIQPCNTNTIIYYTSSDGNIVTPANTNAFGANIVSNTYENGQGKIVFDGNVTTIGYYAFGGCGNLASITVPEGVTSLGDYVFSDCGSLASITIPEGVTSLGFQSFSQCRSLTSLTIPKSVTSIGPYSFICCVGLTSIKVEDGNSTYDSRNGCNAIIETASNTLIAGCQNTIIPNSVTTILFDAFNGCGTLTSITIPKSVTGIEGGAFGYCVGLTSIKVEAGNRTYDSRDGCNAIIETATNKLMFGCQNTVIPNTVTYIESQAFAWFDCLTSINIPNSVTGIGDYAFNGCSGLTSINIPNDVVHIGCGAFQNCSNLTDYYVNWTTPLDISSCPSSSPSEIFSIAYLANTTLHVPAGTKALYEAADVWKDFGTIVEEIVAPDSVEIADATVYSRTTTVTTEVKYTRTFDSTNWESLYIPFSIPVATLAEKGLTVAELNDTQQWDLDGDGVADSTRVEFFTLTSGSTQANYPYLIKANAPFTLTLNLEDVELKAAEDYKIDCSSVKQKFTFVGSYAGVSGSRMYSNNYYTMAEGGLRLASSESVSLNPQRWYLKIENRNGTPVQHFAPSIRFVVDGIEEDAEATGLGIVTDGEDADLPIYSLDGKKQDPARISKGIYVQNGKKVIVR